ncbi:MAG: PAS domain S-box protein [Acidobacteriales bacterium]|nr:PAS domain S-box protein [Terriglobales bacterium]
MSSHRQIPAPVSLTDVREHKGRLHTVQFYSDDQFLLDALGRLIGAALGAGDAGIVIATQAHRDELARRLTLRGLDVAEALEEGRYVVLDAAETLSRFMVNGWPDAQRFKDLISAVITRAQESAHRRGACVTVFGEMVALLWAEGKTEAALRLEQLWNELAQSHAFSLVCAYPLAGFYREDHAGPLQRICAEHTEVIPAESYTLASEDERLRHVAGWQQKAIALEDETVQRRKAEESATRLAAIVESAEDAIASKDLNGIVTSWNQAAERMFGYKAEEIIGKPITTIIPPELHSDEAFILDKIRRGERIEHFETVRRTKDGRLIDVSLTISPVKNGEGEIIGAAKIARDITERKQTEEGLRRAEKLAATGQLAASIAHEINNPMQSLTNLLALMAYRSSLDEGTRELLSLAEAELARMSHISRQMLSFYRESDRPVPVSVTEVLDDVLELYAMRVKANRIKVERRYDCAEAIHAFPVEMRQLFANLVGNAIEAVGERGRILVHVFAGREWSNGGRRGLRIVIADNGHGIRAEFRNRIFEAFFTTKKEKGTGLGLWVVRGIVSKHEGLIRWRSSTKPGRSGTVFSVFLPAEAAWRAASISGVGTDAAA